MMLEAALTSETSVDIRLRTRQYISEDSELHTCRRENLKSHTPVTIIAYLLYRVAWSYFIYILSSPVAPQPYKWALATFRNFPDKILNKFLFKGWGCQPHAQPSTWRTRSPYLYPRRQGSPAITPDTG
jgi:hypothetical protein